MQTTQDNKNPTHGSSFSPTWEGPIEGYTVNYITKVLPTLGRLYEFEDLFNEAFEVYLQTKKRYTIVDNPAWFMALYKRCLASRFIDLIHKLRGYKHEVAVDLVPDDTFMEWNEGPLVTTLQRLPLDLKESIVRVIEGLECSPHSISTTQLRLRLWVL